MIKIFNKLFILIFFLTINTFANSENKITITGNKRIPNETIIVLGNISVNENFD